MFLFSLQQTEMKEACVSVMYIEIKIQRMTGRITVNHTLDTSHTHSRTDRDLQTCTHPQESQKAAWTGGGPE